MMCGSPRLGTTNLAPFYGHSTRENLKTSDQNKTNKPCQILPCFFLPSSLLPMDPLKATASWFLAFSDISIVVAMADGEGRKDLPGQCLLLSRLVGRSSDSRNYTTTFYSSTCTRVPAHRHQSGSDRAKPHFHSSLSTCDVGRVGGR